MEEYKIVYEGGSDEIVEKKSRFIANVFPVETEDEALKIIDEHKKKYWDARHNCYAFIIGEHGEMTRCTDDGEPAGTAGRPILEVLNGAGVHNVLLIVTRYFGGTLLGTGGLVRAYSQAAKAGLEASTVVTKQVGKEITIGTDYNGVGKLQYITAQLEVITLDTVYTDAVEIKLLAPLEKVDALKKKVVEATSGQAKIEESDELYFIVVDGEAVIV